MAAARLDFGGGRKRYRCSGSRTATERGRSIHFTPLGAVDVLACSAAVLRPVCGLWGRSDFHSAVVAVLLLQRALWIAIASGLRDGDGHSRSSGSADRSVGLAAATGVRARRVR